MSIDAEQEQRRRLIYVGERLKAATRELEEMRQLIDKLRDDDGRDHRQFVYATMHAKYLRDERLALAAEHKELKEIKEMAGN